MKSNRHLLSFTFSFAVGLAVILLSLPPALLEW